MQTPAQTERQALDTAIAATTCCGTTTIQPPRPETGLLFQELAAVAHVHGQTAVVAHSRHMRAGNAAVVSLVIERPYTHYEVFEPHLARQLAAQLIRAAEIAERHNLDANRPSGAPAAAAC